MRIAQVQVSGFRCLAAVTVGFDDLTALVGPGGAGKSTVLRALDWFFHGGDLEERDRHQGADGREPAEKVVVAVTFENLSAADREILGIYAQGSESTLTRSWTEGDGEKLSGTALVLPQFMPIREIPARARSGTHMSSCMGISERNSHCRNRREVPTR